MHESDIKNHMSKLPVKFLELLISIAKKELREKKQIRGFKIARGYENQVKFLPQRATPGSGGYDFWPLEDITLQAGAEYLFDTGVKAYMPEDEILLINIRSSYGINHGIELCNEQGWIDSDYYSNPDNDGVIIIKVKNSGSKSFFFSKEKPFAQGLFISYHITSDDKPRLPARQGGVGSSF